MRSKRLIGAILAFCYLLFFVIFVHAEVKLPALIGDNMVIQQGVKACVWGWAEQGEPVSVTMEGQSVMDTADTEGRWKVRIGPFPEGGPYELTISGKNTIILKNVLVGEVWVASGQSNMAWQMRNAVNGEEEVSRANYPQIRLFTVAQATSLSPKEDVEGRWVVCTPEVAGYFSAVAYFFGRELHQTLKVPVGLIHSSWGGTPAEAWTSRETLASDTEIKSILDSLNRALKILPEAQSRYKKTRAKWEENNYLQDPGNKGLKLGYASYDCSEEGWQGMNLPRGWESSGLPIDGAVWFRTVVDIPEFWAGKELTLRLGSIDDFDITYFNGVKVGETGNETPNYWTVPRKYTIPGSHVRAGRNVIAVRVFDHYGSGGFTGFPADMALSLPGSDPIPLAGKWLYKVELGVEPVKVDYSTAPSAPFGGGNPNTPTVLYNAMIAPLTPYTICGVIWYQGESNVDRALQYQKLFPMMIRNWRAAWGVGDFPFLYVQLANYLEKKTAPGESGWAELREAQLKTLDEPETGMAVIIDIGEADDIHPKNKQDVGHRLALWAMAKTYGHDIEYSGPIYQSIVIEGNKVRIRFSHAQGLHTSDSGKVKGFSIAGADGKFIWADANIEGNEVVVWSDSVTQPAAVRYGWADNPDVNLYNGAGLPASPFRTDNSVDHP
jgi:sialate O-acetylesterase